MRARRVPRFLVQHSRILIALLAGVAAYLAVPHAWSQVTRVLTGWNVSTILFLALTYLFVTRLGAEQLRSRYEGEDPTAPVILLVVTVAALLSLVAIIELLSTLRHVMPFDRSAHLALAALTVVASWLLVPTMFTLHYADMFYSARPDSRPLTFPGAAEPAFWDFAYFSFTIAAACQTADVATTSVPIRKAVIVHEIVSFVFNVSILGFAINVTAGLLGSG